jgi:hypothetical protein
VRTEAAKKVGAAQVEGRSAEPTPEAVPGEQADGDENEESDEDYFLKMHMGLVKI